MIRVLRDSRLFCRWGDTNYPISRDMRLALDPSQGSVRPLDPAEVCHMAHTVFSAARTALSQGALTRMESGDL